MCRRPLGAGVLLAALVCALSAPEAQAQKKDKAGPKNDPPIDSARWAPGEYVGVLRSTPGSDRLFTIAMEETQVVPAGRSIRHVQLRAKTSYREVEFQASAKAKVRTLVLPEQYDDKGKVKKYTEKEKADLKGKDKHLPGYESSLEKLEPGQVVRVRLTVAPARAAKPKDKDKEAPDDGKAEKRMQASLIVIAKDSAEGSPALPKRKPK